MVCVGSVLCHLGGHHGERGLSGGRARRPRIAAAFMDLARTELSVWGRDARGDHSRGRAGRGQLQLVGSHHAGGDVSASYERTKVIRRKYVKYFDKEKPIVDVGFGDGMFMKWMQEQGYAVIGVDQNPRWIERASSRDIRVVVSGAVEFLRDKVGAFGGIVLCVGISHRPGEV